MSRARGNSTGSSRAKGDQATEWGRTISQIQLCRSIRALGLEGSPVSIPPWDLTQYG